MHFKAYKRLLSPRNRMNIYRGCTHGCIYCDARSTCYQMNHVFEDIEVKADAPHMLRNELRSKRQRCMVNTGSMSDPYIPLEDELAYTRQCLEVIDAYGFGVTLQTKSSRVLRDLDLLKSIHKKAKCVVQMTLTTYDEALCRILEPNVSTTLERVEALKTLRDSGIPTVVWLCPILPFINDTQENLLGILDYCRQAGVWGILNFGMSVTLRQGDREYFYAALDRHFPGLKARYHSTYGYSYELRSDRHDALMGIFYNYCRQHGMVCDNKAIFSFLSQLPHCSEQLSLFE